MLGDVEVRHRPSLGLEQAGRPLGLVGVDMDS